MIASSLLHFADEEGQMFVFPPEKANYTLCYAFAHRKDHHSAGFCTLKSLHSQAPNGLGPTHTHCKKPSGTYLHSKGHNKVGADHDKNVDSPQDRSAEQLAEDDEGQLVLEHMC